MTKHTLHPAASSLAMRPTTRYLKLGLWLRLAIVGMFVTAAGVVMLADSKLGFPAVRPLAVVLCGIAMAAWSWKRVGELSETVDAAVPNAAAMAPGPEVRGTPSIARTPQVRFLALLHR